MNNQAINSSFWQLISGKTIEIPNYQREYAQGRKNRRAEGIKKGLVDAFYSALTDDTPLELDFIFGGKENNDDDKFHPVDGQQRLTILYLLHWYIFQRTNDEAALCTLKDHFSYATRTTSRTFCEKTCENDSSLNWGEDKLSVQLEDKSWFTGAMGHDPTVQSMLEVLDCIHQKFCGENDFKGFADKLKGQNCPITFYYYDLSENGTSVYVRDLYIKMNARGLPLTDFEIFKAELQKNVSDLQGFDLLKGCFESRKGYFESCKIGDSSAERITLIGKFNNEYTNFFFDLINDKETTSEKFDRAMMNFINEIFRADFFCAVSEKGVPQKNYRQDHDDIKRMSGKEFYNFIKDSGELLVNKYKEADRRNETGITSKDAQNAFVSSLTRIIDLLNFFSESGDKTIFKKDYPREIGYALFDDLFKGNIADNKNNSGLAVDPLVPNTLPFGDFVARNALYAFLENAFLKKFDVLKDEDAKNNYEAWNRFVWKIVRNTDFKGFNEAVETLRGLRQICEKISISVYDVLNHIKKLSRTKKAKDDEFEFEFDDSIQVNGSRAVTMGGRSARLQFEEELLKAKRIIGDSRWEEKIKDAENYFSADGQIWFLFDLAKKDGIYDLDNFNKAFAIAKALFDKEKRLNVNEVPSSLFERAVLAVGAYDPDFTDKDHLEQMSGEGNNSKRFIGKDFREHLLARGKDWYDVTIKLLKTMVDENVQDVKTWLGNYIVNAAGEPNFEKLPEWKKIFIQYNLLDKNVGGFNFTNWFEPEKWNSDKDRLIAVYNTAKRRISSGELHSFALALEIQKYLHKDNTITYHVSDVEGYLGENNLPNRYFTIKCSEREPLNVYYVNGNFVADGVEIDKSIEAACEKLCSNLGIRSDG